MSRTLHVVTHPEATHHVDRLVGGWYDSDLTVDGAATAERIGAALRARIPDGERVEVVASDLRRTWRTAEAIARHLDVAPVREPGLREKSYGRAEGRSQAWLDARLVPPPATGDRMRHHEGVPGAETRLDLATRVYGAVERLLSRERAHQVVVTHGFAATFVVASWIGMPLAACDRVSFSARPGSITTLHEDDRFHDRAVVRMDEQVDEQVDGQVDEQVDEQVDGQG